MDRGTDESTGTAIARVPQDLKRMAGGHETPEVRVVTAGGVGFGFGFEQRVGCTRQGEHVWSCYVAKVGGYPFIMLRVIRVQAAGHSGVSYRAEHTGMLWRPGRTGMLWTPGRTGLLWTAELQLRSGLQLGLKLELV